jgi:hypothetical protein
VEGSREDRKRIDEGSRLEQARSGAPRTERIAALAHILIPVTHSIGFSVRLTGAPTHPLRRYLVAATQPSLPPAVFFTDANTGTVVGDFGTILRSTTGGEPPAAQTSGEQQHALFREEKPINLKTPILAGGQWFSLTRAYGDAKPQRVRRWQHRHDARFSFIPART